VAKLGVNIDHVATIRQARGGVEPDPLVAAAMAEMAGADGITIHLREDRRHIQDHDLKMLRQTVKTRLNLEMAATEAMVAIALMAKPELCTLVPEKRQELTTEGGLDVQLNLKPLTEGIRRLKDGGLTVSLFVNPDTEQIKAASRAGADYVEIHTGAFAEAREPRRQQEEVQRIENAIKFAAKLGLGVNAGHGLNYNNIKRLLPIGSIEEFNIGHAIIARAVLVGLDRAVRDMVELIKYA
jgi:pyridoxine 5-phosphate synthase